MRQDEALFVAGRGGYHTYRIPALTVTLRGTVLAFCEGRRDSARDSGAIDILCRRSTDGGQTWEPPRLVVSGQGDTAGNPAPVVDRRTGIIWLPFCRNLAAGPEPMIIAGQAPRTVWLTWSADDGVSWVTPREITAQVKRPDWTWYATGPCHGVQLASGRLLIPCDHIVGNRETAASVRAHVIYSDDAGDTWQIGGIAQPGTNECVAVETVDGRLYLNCRNHRDDPARVYRRACAWSRDGGASFAEFGVAAELIEPVCQASAIRYSDARRNDRNRVLFANPASSARERLTVRISEDECRSWGAGTVLHAGPAAYSDLAVAHDGTILCLYECGVRAPYETITLSRLTLDWLTAHETI